MLKSTAEFMYTNIQATIVASIPHRDSRKADF